MKNIRIDLDRVVQVMEKKNGKDYSVAALAKETGAGYQSLTNWNNARKIPGVIKTLHRLKEMTGLTLDQLITTTPRKHGK